MPDERAEKLLAYLRQHGERYTVEALRQQMLSEGYSAEEVDGAVQRWTEERRVEPGGVLGRSFLVGLAGTAYTVLAFWVGLTDIGDNPPWWHPSELLAIALPFLLMAQIAAGLGMLFFPRWQRRGRILLFGFLWYLALAILTGGGFCLYVISAGH
jgi:hypothetical protein